MILVIGATGKVGGAAVRELVAAGASVRGASRDPSRLEAFNGAVEPVAVDVDAPETLAPAFTGVDKVFYAAVARDSPTAEPAAIRLAEEAGVKQFVLLSSLGVDYGVGSGPIHQAGEERLRSAQLRWTILRPLEFMTNALRWAEEARARGVIQEPSGSGRRAMIDPRDIGAVAAAVLTSEGHEDKTYALTGPESLTSAEYAQRLSASVGRPIVHEDISEDQFRERFVRMGVPAPLVDSVVGYYALIRDGRLEMVKSDVERLCRRPGRTFAAWAEENAAAFR